MSQLQYSEINFSKKDKQITSSYSKPTSMPIDGDFYVTGKIYCDTIIQKEKEENPVKQEETQRVKDLPPSYEVIENELENCKYRIHKDSLTVDTRNSFMRSFSKDSRWTTLRYIEKNYSKINSDILCKLMSSTYKSDEKWMLKATGLQIKLNKFI